jgi:putative Holliday junction resolvase
MVYVVFWLSMITVVDSFVIKRGNRDFHRRDIGTKHDHYQQQEYCTKLEFYGLCLVLKLSTSSLSLSSKDSDYVPTSTPSEVAHSPDTSIDSAAASATANSTFSNTTDVNCGAGAAARSISTSKKEVRKRYDAELQEAFAQQTRERNPLLGVKSIGVDYGLVRTGVAVTIGYNPEALDVIVTDYPLFRDNEAEAMLPEQVEKEEERRLDFQRARVAERVVELASRENADRIVVGLPLHKNGTEAPQTVLARKFACDHLAIAALRSLGPGVSVYMCDERYTSKEAAARIRSSQSSSRNMNDDLYGLLDGESAKIILEQYYADHLDRYNDRNLRSSDGGANTKNVDPGYNGELVTILDADLVEELTLEYNEKQRLEREQLSAERSDREARAKWRKLEMEKDRIRAEENAANGNVASKKKKKKKKKRKRK